MLQLKPFPENSFACPECGTTMPSITEFRFESINVWADCVCRQCGLEFLQALPIGHTLDHTICIAKKTDTVFSSEGCPAWLSQSLSESYHQRQTSEVAIEKIIFKKYSRVVILNTLDSIYGHVLLKLYNSIHHLDQDSEIGLVLIIPKSFKWLIPNGCAEAWVIDLRLNELKYGYEHIRKFVSEELDRFRGVFLSRAYSHPNLSEVGIQRVTGIAPFRLSNFDKLKPQVTFILREDRWWLESEMDYWFYRICRKLDVLSWGSYILALRQNRLIKRTIRLIEKELPGVNFFLVGLGKTGTFDNHISDDRQVEVNDIVEKAWCAIFAKSQVVIGIHGSNMLLPTALAAGCVEILPEDRYGNMVQDISVRYKDRKQLFFYRFVDQFAKPSSVANKAIAIIRDYKFFAANMGDNQYIADSIDDRLGSR